MKKILYFTGKWCGPCEQFGPIMEQIGTRIPVEKIDVDAEPSITAAYQVRSVPTIVYLKNNKEVSRSTGVKPANLILETFNSL